MISGIESKRYRFKLLSPLHIGDGERLIPSMYAVLGRDMFVVSEKKMAAALKEEGLMDDFVAAFSQNPSGFRLASFLMQHGLHSVNFYREIQAYTLKIKDISGGEVLTFIKAADNRPFIPGSSVKGALRVAAIYKLLKAHPDVKQELLIDYLENELDRLKTAVRREIKKAAKKIGSVAEQVLNQFKLSTNTQLGPNTDIFRAVEVRDSRCFPPSELRVIKVEVVRLNGESVLSINVEALMPEFEFDIEIAINHDILNYFRRIETPFGIPFSEYEALLTDPMSAISEMVSDLVKHEQAALKDETLKRKLKQVTDGEPNFRFGWGQGILSATLMMLLPEPLQKQVRDTFFKGKKDSEFPLTRKTHAGTLLGFAHVSPA